jgi:glyoxylase-like metal-dependent hydrolase (beta-lactamase superfamily II)
MTFQNAESNPLALPGGIRVFERGWLSSNNILVLGTDSAALIDSGYSTHAPQTLALVAAALPGRALDLLLNTHLHSDHCGGNAALQGAYPGLRTLIPAGQAAWVRDWNTEALGYTPASQTCPRFSFDAVLQDGSELRLGDGLWQVHASPGHDPHSVILFEPVSRLLVSADALWERGFGVVFPELDGADAFDQVSGTLDLIEALQPTLVIPGHGQPFADVTQALAVARQRLDAFVTNPQRHRHHAAKALLKFKLLDVQRLTRTELLTWARGTPYLARLLAQVCGDQPLAQGLDRLVLELVQTGAARWQDNVLVNG